MEDLPPMLSSPRSVLALAVTHLQALSRPNLLPMVIRLISPSPSGENK
jgi:hypothetical protein